MCTKYTHTHKVCVIPILFWMCTKIPIPIPILFVNVYTNTNTNSIRSTHIPIPIPQLYTKFVYWYFCAKNLWVLAATERLKTFQAIACCFEHVPLMFYRLVIFAIIILNNMSSDESDDIFIQADPDISSKLFATARVRS